MKKIFFFLVLIPLNACALMFNGTTQDVKINFYNEQTGEKISNDKVKIMGKGDRILTLDEEEKYTLKRDIKIDLHCLSEGYKGKSYPILGKVSGLYWLNLIPIILIAPVGLINVIVDVSTGAAYKYDDIKIFLTPNS